MSTAEDTREVERAGESTAEDTREVGGEDVTVEAYREEWREEWEEGTERVVHSADRTGHTSTMAGCNIVCVYKRRWTS